MKLGKASMDYRNDLNICLTSFKLLYEFTQFESIIFKVAFKLTFTL